MIVIVFTYLVSAYVISGLICWLAFLRDFNQRSLSVWQRLLAVLASFMIVVFWPISIIIEIRKQASPTPEARSLAYAGLDSDDLSLTENSDSRLISSGVMQ